MGGLGGDGQECGGMRAWEQGKAAEFSNCRSRLEVKVIKVSPLVRISLANPLRHSFVSSAFII